MNENKEILKKIFDDNYDKTYNRLTEMSESKNFTIESVEMELQSLYRFDGQAWTGRADPHQTEIDASIAAYQVFIKRWKEKNKK
jgi:cyclopropane fatty-acyl-phospholipid synthase-like methyltransferase